MNDEQHEEVGQIWDKIMVDVEELIFQRTKGLTDAQLQFIWDMSVEQGYHAGWKAVARRRQGQ
jgi:hypothetical protein